MGQPKNHAAVALGKLGGKAGTGAAKARTSEQALDELSKMSGTGFDGMLVRLLLRELKSERASSAKDNL